MLEVRHIAGDAELSSLLIGGARRQWRTGIASRFDELVEHTQARWQRSGQIAHRAEPDLKCGRGGLRDVQLLNALAIAQLADVYPSQLAGLADRLARRGAPGAAQRAHRTAPGLRPRPRPRCWPSTPTRSAPRCASVTGSIWRGCSPMPPAPSATTSTPGMRTAANALPRRGLVGAAAPGAPAARRRRHRVRRRGDPGPRCPPGARPRPDPAGGRRLGDHRPADGGVDAEPAGRLGAGTAHAVAARRRSRTCW